MKNSIKKDFPELYQFFGGYFPPADFEDISDEEVVIKYKNDCLKSTIGKKNLEEAKNELQKLFFHVDSYWEDIIETSNRHFDTVKDTSNWLEMIMKKLQE